ncbi:RDD family protein [Actinoplanes oblitus]|uniref:RDD family protein n=1 Tax=Actinoplanes oblitus TaxID=3040509 RepID=A0ABY8WN03_9ACTN|nr:RDD family protein [Actinoplanes oblitus]WIM99220.1 RDD family protein [Actinoplanes oblitus]
MASSSPDLTYAHPDGVRISPVVSPFGRLMAQLFDLVLFVGTLGVGWLVWALRVFGRGQTPGRQLLGHAVADVRTGRPVGFGRMLVREVLVKWVLGGALGVLTLGLYPVADVLFVFGDRQRTLHDRTAGTIVVHKWGLDL